MAGLLSFSTRVHCPFLQAALPSLALLACLLHRNIHTLLVAARCRHSLRHRFPAGLPLRSLTDCFISSHPFITVDRHALLASTDTQSDQTKKTTCNSHSTIALEPIGPFESQGCILRPFVPRGRFPIRISATFRLTHPRQYDIAQADCRHSSRSRLIVVRQTPGLPTECCEAIICPRGLLEAIYP